MLVDFTEFETNLRLLCANYADKIYFQNRLIILNHILLPLKNGKIWRKKRTETEISIFEGNLKHWENLFPRLCIDYRNIYQAFGWFNVKFQISLYGMTGIHWLSCFTSSFWFLVHVRQFISAILSDNYWLKFVQRTGRYKMCNKFLCMMFVSIFL